MFKRGDIAVALINMSSIKKDKEYEVVENQHPMRDVVWLKNQLIAYPASNFMRREVK